LDQIRKFWAFLGCALSGIFIRKEYEKGMSKRFLKNYPQPLIYCSNHASFLDILVMSQVAQGAFFYMGKKSLEKNPVLRIFFKTIDIAFERENKTDAYRAFKLAGMNLDKGMNLIIFPEGSITSNPPNLRSFKPGAFRLSIEKGIPIIPVSIFNSWDIFYREGQSGARPGIIHCFIHKPVFQNEYSLNPERELKERVFSIIDTKIQDYTTELSLPEGWAPSNS
jgi:1-acyl-sn-glycerol-3-phosphate acyltransferase